MTKTQAEIRKEVFDEVGNHARALADQSLQEIDAVLAAEDLLHSELGWACSKGWIADEAAEDIMRTAHDKPADSHRMIMPGEIGGVATRSIFDRP